METGETRLQTIYRNTASIHTVVNAMKPFRSDTILVIVTNPVEVLIPVAQKLSGLPPTQVFGCGTLLDTIRLRGLLASKVGVRLSKDLVLSKALLTCILGRSKCDRSLCVG